MLRGRGVGLVRKEKNILSRRLRALKCGAIEMALNRQFKELPWTSTCDPGLLLLAGQKLRHAVTW